MKALKMKRAIAKGYLANPCKFLISQPKLNNAHRNPLKLQRRLFVFQRMILVSQRVELQYQRTLFKNQRTACR